MARTWSEELVTEYYEWQGYFISRNLSLGPGEPKSEKGRGGGLNEADLIAIKYGTKSAVHIEVGYIQHPKEIEKELKGKFEQDRQEVIREKLFEKDSSVSISNRYIVTGGIGTDRPRSEVGKKLKKNGAIKIPQENIEIMSFNKFLDEVKEGIKDYKDRKYSSKNPKPMLPGNFPLLKLIEASMDWRPKKKNT
ncbi:MAG: hypothetical protein QME51_09485 [Planctomycetota bacterium]|nr:hypothetical protein [Planctomycetota bacterium]